MYNESTNCLNLRNFRSFDSKHIGPERPSKRNQVDLCTRGLQIKYTYYIYIHKLFFKCLSFWRIHWIIVFWVCRTKGFVLWVWRIKYPCNRLWPFTFKPWVPVVIYFLIFRNCMIKFGNLSSWFQNYFFFFFSAKYC